MLERGGEDRERVNGEMNYRIQLIAQRDNRIRTLRNRLIG